MCACCVLKVKLIDLVNLNRMKVVSRSNETDRDANSDICIMCDTIDDFIKYEQHRLNIVSQVSMEDMKVENKYYGNVIVLNRMSTTTLY